VKRVVARMAAKGIASETLRAVLAEWFRARGFRDIVFKENLSPEFDDAGRYVVDYEAVFEPRGLDQGRVDVWGTREGVVAVGFETWERIAARLSVGTSQPDRNVAGQEPDRLTVSGLIAVLDAVADGQMSVLASVWPGSGLASPRAVAAPAVLQTFRASGNTWLRWLGSAPQQPHLPWQRLLEFRPWS